MRVGKGKGTRRTTSPSLNIPRDLTRKRPREKERKKKKREEEEERGAVREIGLIVSRSGHPMPFS